MHLTRSYQKLKVKVKNIKPDTVYVKLDTYCDNTLILIKTKL